MTPLECRANVFRDPANHGDFGVLDQECRVGLGSVVDQQASLFGHDCHSPGDIKLTFGTGAFVLGLTVGPVLQATSPPPFRLLPTCAWAKKDERARYALDGGVLRGRGG